MEKTISPQMFIFYHSFFHLQLDLTADPTSDKFMVDQLQHP
jgi:hypothetical protein